MGGKWVKDSWEQKKKKKADDRLKEEGYKQGMEGSREEGIQQEGEREESR